MSVVPTLDKVVLYYNIEDNLENFAYYAGKENIGRKDSPIFAIIRVSSHDTLLGRKSMRLDFEFQASEDAYRSNTKKHRSAVLSVGGETVECTTSLTFSGKRTWVCSAESDRTCQSGSQYGEY